jgi:hypothetical protein
MPGNQANVEYWFRLAYECLHGGCYGGSVDTSQFMAWLAHLWLWIIFLGYTIAIIALILLVYAMVRLFELRHREEDYYSTLLIPAGAKGGTHPRWEHIQSLVESASSSDWREAIIEADVMLDEELTKQGYAGDGLGEKLKTANSAKFRTLQDAWEAHKVRNQIAHQGSAFDLSDSLAKRTIAHYEAVFREFNSI